MFETSLVQARVAGSRRRAGLLTISIAAHTTVIVGSVAVGLASVNFPAMAPDEYRTAPSFAVMAIPPPLGNPNGGARPQPQPQAPQPQPPPPNQITAPPVVPDEITPANAGPSVGAGETNDSGGDGPGLVPGPVGVPWGDPNSIANDLNVPVAVETPRVEDRIYQAHEVTAPVILRRVEPRFPTAMQRAGMSATVVVRCVIDKQGNVRDAQVLVSSLPPFNAAVVSAVEQWRFKPATLSGRPVDSYLELRVRFESKR